MPLTPRDLGSQVKAQVSGDGDSGQRTSRHV